MAQYSDPSAEDNKRQDARLRVWKAMIYPESAKPNWMQIIESEGVCCCVSPIHDKDRYTQEDIDKREWPEGDPVPEVGDLKKPHYHLVIQYSGKRSFTQVYEFLKVLYVDGKAPIPQIPYGDIDRAVQYLVHWNNKEKAQYLRSDIVSINGFDYQIYFKLNSEQEEEVFDGIMQYIIDHGIVEIWDLMFHLRLLAKKTNLYAEMYRFCRKHPNLISSLIHSRRYGYTNQERKTYEVNENGEFIEIERSEDNGNDENKG